MEKLNTQRKDKVMEIKFSTDNDAFSENKTDECRMILRGIGEHLRDGHRGGIIMDSNGNKVGRWSL
jgi:hypothetical protein